MRGTGVRKGGGGDVHSVLMYEILKLIKIKFKKMS